MYYNLNGISTETPLTDRFWFMQSPNGVIFKENDITSELEATCIKLHDCLAEKIFGDAQVYFNTLLITPEFITNAGLDSESSVSKAQFESTLASLPNVDTANRMLYLFDARNLISSLQNSIIESKYLVGEFYKILNRETFLLHRSLNDNGMQFASGPIVSNIFSIINSIFINLHSQLDFVVKIAYEFQHLNSDFSKYPKLSSSNKTFGDHKSLQINKDANSLFSRSPLINQIVSIRNEIVHNSSFDNMPKVYQVFSNGELIEKFILLPDFSENGFLESSKNRKRFYSRDIKLNDILPSIVTSFWSGLLGTLKAIEQAQHQTKKDDSI